MRTLDLALELEPDYAQWNYTVPYPRTHVWNELASHGRLLARDWGEFSNWYPAFLPFAYETPDDLIRVRTLVLRKFYLRPRYVWRRLRKIRTAGDVLRYVALLIDFLAVLGRAGGGKEARARASASATRTPSTVAASGAPKSVAA
jgi:hypothetical protein